MTLLELVIVMAILSTLLGLGLGALRRLDTSARQSVAQVKDAMRSARLFALREGVPATVIVDSEAGAVYGLGVKSAGNWHFEDADGSGWPVAALHAGGALDPDGVLGGCLRLDPETTLVIDELPPGFDSPHGFAVDVFLAPERDTRPMTVLERPGAWSLALDEAERLVVTVALQPVGSLGAEGLVDRLVVEVPQDVLTPERFTRLTAVFDGRRLHVAFDGRRSVDDTLLGEVRRMHVPADAPVSTGVDARAYRGRLDELRLGVVVVGRHAELPDDVTLSGPSQELRLDADGHLDPEFHTEPVTLRLAVRDSIEVLAVELGTLGTVRSWVESAP